MMRRKPIVMAILATAMILLASAPLRAQPDQGRPIDGHCQYPDRIAEQRHETLLILCDTARVARDGAATTIEFGRRTWGAMAQFTGDMPGDKMAVSRVTLRDGRSVAATGSCELFRRADGRLTVISCLAKAASRWVAANFVPSNL